MQIKTEDLSKDFSGQQVLKNIQLSVDDGEIVAVLGPSGCGKSTLLRILAGLEKSSSGKVELHEEFSFVFQMPLLLDWRTALANTELPLEMKKLDAVTRKARCKEMLELVGLGNDLFKYPDELSGGMKMRVSLARALVTNPQVLLLDEPFAALDEMTRERLNLEVLKLKEHRQISALFVTHNIFEAVFMSDRVLIMNAAPAEIVSEIVIDLPHPRTPQLKSTAVYAEAVGKVQKALRQVEGE